MTGCGCGCSSAGGSSSPRCYVRSIPGCAPRFTNRNTYTRRTNTMSVTGWHGKHRNPSFLDYKMGGSFAGRNRGTCSTSC